MFVNTNFIESIFTTDVIKISNIFACGSFILDHILVFSSIIVLSGLTLVFMSGGYVWKIIDGVGRWVPVVASGLYINDVLGNPLGVPGQGRQGGQGQPLKGKEVKDKEVKDKEVKVEMVLKDKAIKIKGKGNKNDGK